MIPKERFGALADSFAKKAGESYDAAKVSGVPPAVLAKAFEKAMEARDSAYAPYSKFQVGAALVVRDSKEKGGYKIVTGSNSENVVYQGTCAERNALGTAIGLGYRTKDIACVIVVGAPRAASELDASVSPCGVCRQGLMEIIDPDTPVMHSVGSKGRDVTGVKIHTLQELLPFAFSPAAINKKMGGKKGLTFREIAGLQKEKEKQLRLDA